MALRSRSDGKERLGYVTMDNKFIIVDSGTSHNVNMKFKAIGNQIYFVYPTSKEMPSNNYSGFLTNFDGNNEYWIPVKYSVHTHPSVVVIILHNLIVFQKKMKPQAIGLYILVLGLKTILFKY